MDTSTDPRMEAFLQLEREAAEAKHDLMFTRGKIIVAVITIYIIAVSICTIVLGLITFDGLSLLGAVINIICVGALFKGVAWARYFFIAMLIFGAFFNFIALGTVAPDYARHNQNMQTMYDYQTGEFYGVPITSEFESYGDEPVNPYYYVYSVLLAINLIIAIVLIFSKSVKVYTGSLQVAKDAP